MRYTFYKAGQEVHTDNLAQFCRANGLRRSHMNEVIEGKKKSYKGFSLSPAQENTDPLPEPEDEDGTVAVEDVLAFAEIAAQSYDREHRRTVMRRIEKLRRGEQINVGMPKEEIDKILAADPEMAQFIKSD